ncbi:cupin domain-containing protein [Limibacillus halophilus]|uniref:Quercetin dioxygenase-like cupin family protein n=1 Tax=Limibacillus halophilus TaxID=1579333 RepID=A0A839SLQ3_9PROT|nr:cupin domain-containing protein [Limibacillus halophilus]MBB3063827.1 quercetin dioxygenase-like cupin family protein [Limibacillus halophilus]
MSNPQKADPTKGPAICVQPDEGQSWWQPEPANGYGEVRISRRNVPGLNLASGIQVIAPGGFIRDHQHPDHQEILFFYEGTGVVELDGEPHPVQPGTTFYLTSYRRHKIMNTGTSDLKMFWTIMPGGLEDFFEQIGRPRTPGEPAPEPFARPEDVEKIEVDSIFAPIRK